MGSTRRDAQLPHRQDACATRFFARSLFHRRSRNQNPNLQKRTRNTRRVISKKRSPVTRRWFTEASGTQICFTILGNAYFRTRDFGRAILNYERALALDQHHPEATANLQIARDESRALELQPTRLERYLQFASINQYSIAAAVALWLGIFGIVALIFARRRSAALMSLSILCLLVCAVAVWAIHTLDKGSKGRALAIVTGNRRPGAPRHSGHSKQRSRVAGWQRNQDSKHARRLDVRRAAE